MYYSHRLWIIAPQSISLWFCILRIWTPNCEDFVYFDMFHVFIFYLLAAPLFLSLILQMFFAPAALRDICVCQHSFDMFLFPLLFRYINSRGTLDKAYYQIFINTLFDRLFKILIKLFQYLNCSTNSVIQYLLTQCILWALCIGFILFQLSDQKLMIYLCQKDNCAQTVLCLLCIFAVVGAFGMLLSWSPSSIALQAVDMLLHERDESSFLLSRTVWVVFPKSFGP